jgi:hypothetical protein
MSTVNKEIADAIVRGEYAEDRPVKIVKYTNAWGAEAYGVIFEGQDLDKYEESDYVINPVTYWEKNKQ